MYSYYYYLTFRSTCFLWIKPLPGMCDYCQTQLPQKHTPKVHSTSNLPPPPKKRNLTV